MSEIAERAEALVRHDSKGGFPPQQHLPILTGADP